MIKKLLKIHKYPPDGQPEAIDAVMTQCELWADNIMDQSKIITYLYKMNAFEFCYLTSKIKKRHLKQKNIHKIKRDYVNIFLT